MPIGAPGRPRLNPPGPLFGRAAVVGQKQNQRVVQPPNPPQRRDQPPDVLIEAVHLRRIDRHPVRQIPPLGLGHLRPWPRRLVARAKRRARRQQPHRLLPGKSLRADRVPADVIAPRVLRDVRRLRLERPMRGDVGQVQEEGDVGAPGGLSDELDRPVGEHVGHVAVVGKLGGLRSMDKKHLGAEFQRFFEIHAAAARRAPVAVETAIRRPVPGLRSDMPFADHQRGIASGPQRLGQCDALFAQPAPIGRQSVIARHVADADAVRIAAGQQRGARRTTAGRVVKPCEPQAAGGQGVEMGVLISPP